MKDEKSVSITNKHYSKTEFLENKIEPNQLEIWTVATDRKLK